MNKVRRKLVVSAMAALLILLTALLAVINVINFALVAEDADRIKETIAEGGGEFRDMMKNGEGPVPGGRAGPMGPDSPETPFTARFFTVRFDKNGKAETVAHNISAFTEDEAKEIAGKLVGEKRTGWVMTTYRFRVYKKGGETYVTVIDQGRELTPSYRILVVSVVGEAVVLILALAFLSAFSRKLIRPLEEADRKQKKFIGEAEAAIKVPLTVIGADVEIIERTSGPTDRTASIRRQVGRMTEITKKLRTMSLIEGERELFDLSAAVKRAALSSADGFSVRGIALDLDVEEGVKIGADEGSLSKAVTELFENAAKFAKSRASATLKREGERVTFSVTNDADLPDGPVEQAFDRFVRLPNAGGVPGDGIGLCSVRDAIREAGGRVSAVCSNGEFTVRATF
ncbi:MAG: HAMP domain-containing histidine kinase [Clostridia bacterium]|nr:HAMP domain-containing histidine kinase [Clostridia bacterium]